MKNKLTCSFLLAASALLTIAGSMNALGAEPSYYYSFDGDCGDATPIERELYYSDAGLVPSDGISFFYDEGMLGQCLHMNGDEALKLPVQMNTESYTVSYWLKPDKIINCTPSLMITSMGFEAEKFINVALAAENRSPNIWTHAMEPVDERCSTGMPRLLKENEWTYITMVVDENMSDELLGEYGAFADDYNTGVSLYINGFLISIGRVPKLMCTDTSSYWFGVNIWDDLYRGCVDELCFYDTALSESEVKALYLEYGGDPNAEKPSANVPGIEWSYKPNDGSLSDDYVPLEQGTISGSQNYLNMDNAAPLVTQGTDTTTNAYADFTLLLAVGFVLMGTGFIIKHHNVKKNSYN